MPKKTSLNPVASRAGSQIAKPEVARTAQAVHPRVEFIRSVRFIGLGLDRCDAKIDRITLALARESKTPLEHAVSLKHHVLSHEDDHFIVGADFEIIQHPSNSEAKLVVIAATFSARFDLAEKSSEDLVRAFANLEARLIFFPYIRHFVSDISYRMSIDPIVLPMTSELENKSQA